MADIIFLNVEDVLLAHADTLEEEGGLGGVRDHRLLDAAVAMPRQQFGGTYLHPDFAAMAAAYLFHIAQNHPFFDGNKRTAALSALAFLRVNGIEQLPPPQYLETATRRVAAGEQTKDELVRWMRKQIGGGNG
ncbi:putative death-on-curing family protein [Nitrospira sp. KM1]|uniref:type II toxin-antitoxin system death-on-curing family toxin n=1 Tax=Nitrospira sp. KM1 TaxID=1936990 RepID=UPI0013A7A6B6|nr:type II toxin-antitoxin system death-on-curing family toxin [Nitrospira sp. KM1]BCA56611.1 putative death-on-curing family protein [Nitrospira sp. KM1]